MKSYQLKIIFFILGIIFISLLIIFGSYWYANIRQKPAKISPPTPPSFDPKYTPVPAPDLSWIPPRINKYPWNPKTQEGATDAHLGVNLRGTFQSLKENKLSLVANGQVVMLDITKDTVFQARPKNLDLSLPVEQRTQQFKLLNMTELKSGNIIEVLIKRAQDYKEIVTLVNRLD